ncbi:hypothetical protein [Dechloromonas sp. CZR5]|uniref:hypothetical protein n=1 Tax=Dechloromonas sp. CZR5 TaxID=2608630 RepID=UPI00123CBDAC|nr:hypothetical protein [Dechloromonas sp. CZR5]
MTLFLISAARAVIEMLGLCLIGQGVLHILAGCRRESNRIYQLFDLVTRAPRQLVAVILPGFSGKAVGVVCFVILLLIWIGLAFLRKII